MPQRKMKRSQAPGGRLLCVDTSGERERTPEEEKKSREQWKGTRKVKVKKKTTKRSKPNARRPGQSSKKGYSFIKGFTRCDTTEEDPGLERHMPLHLEVRLFSRKGEYPKTLKIVRQQTQKRPWRTACPNAFQRWG